MTHVTDDASFDPRLVRGWLQALHGQSTGWMHIGHTVNVCDNATPDVAARWATKWAGNKAFELPPLDLDGARSDVLADITEYVAGLDARSASGIYVQVTTTGVPPHCQIGCREGCSATNHRGTAADALSLPGFAADIDIAGPGHKTDEALPPDEEAARLIIAASGLPEPTVWQRTGGGMYPWWLLDKPAELRRECSEQYCGADGGPCPGCGIDTGAAGHILTSTAEMLSCRLGAIIAQSAKKLGWHYGTGVHDLARVLRIPGTVNRKEGLARTSTLINDGGDRRRYTWTELADAILGVELDAPTRPVNQAPRERPAAVRPGMSPLDAFEAAATIADLLEPLGWEYVRNEGPAHLWRRPGGTSEYSAKWNVGGVPVLVVHSDHAGLPAGAGQRLTLSRVAAELHYRGDTRAFAKALINYAGGNPNATLPNIANLPSIAAAVRTACNISEYDSNRGAEDRVADLKELAGAADTVSAPSRSREVAPIPFQGGSAPASSTPAGTGPPAPGEPSKEADPLAEFSDARLAETLAYRVFNGRYIWTAGLGWFRWDSKRWRECDLVEAVEAVRKYVLGWLSREIRSGKAAPGSDRIKALMGLLSGARINGITALARGLIVRDAAEFDGDPDILNTPSGVVDLRTGELLPHNPAFLCTKVTEAAYRHGAEHPDWKTALDALPSDVADWMQLRMGQAITGHMPPDDLLIVSQGGGENGKTTLYGTVGAVLGDYYRLVSDRILLANPQDHPTELMDLRGLRFAMIEETPEARQLSVARLKKVVGTPEVTARHIRKDSVTFKSSHTLFVSTNYLPTVAETDHGTWRRLAAVHFPYRFVKRPEDVKGPQDRLGDPTLRDRLKTSPGAREAALAWLVEGARRWYREGRIMTTPPIRVQVDTHAWRAESDQILAYLTDRIEFDDAAHIMTTELLADFNQWLGGLGHRAWGDRVLASRLAGHDEITAHSVTKTRIRNRPGLSRSADIRHGWIGEDKASGVSIEVPAMYMAWIGVRFKTGHTQSSDQGN